MITLRLLQCGEYLELARGVQYNHRGPYRREAGGSELKRSCNDGSRGQHAAGPGHKECG